ncbi:DnaB-like helicase N-terminal domain-containing protein [Streptomyces sp. NPDC018347]|uniref:DnaB-like helicase N-terminal domain-containing protein n=1 Tax=Streptomyces sp. NPDC018347 TaxID=3157193 RepID=UPI0033EA0DF4
MQSSARHRHRHRHHQQAQHEQTRQRLLHSACSQRCRDQHPRKRVPRLSRSNRRTAVHRRWGRPRVQSPREYSTALDVEAQLLCSLLWAPAESAKRAVAALTSADFYRPVNAALFTAISELALAGKPHNSAHVFTTLQQEGRTSGHLGKQLTKALTDISTIGVPSAELEHKIAAVLTQAYRRGFREAARSLAQAAEELPEDQLFEHLLGIGRERRAASQRLAAIREGRP